jgi:hypothetical protein
MNIRYAQHKGGQKLHIVFTNGEICSQPLCGKKGGLYRMTINVPLAHACMNCVRLRKNNDYVRKVYNTFIESLKI